MTIKKLLLSIVLLGTLAPVLAQETKTSKLTAAKDTLVKTLKAVRPTAEIVLGVGLIAITAPVYASALSEGGLRYKIRHTSQLLAGHTALLLLTAHGVEDLKKQLKDVDFSSSKKTVKKFILKYLD